MEILKINLTSLQHVKLPLTIRDETDDDIIDYRLWDLLTMSNDLYLYLW